MLPVQTICFVRAFFIAPLFSIYPLKRYKRYLIFSVYIFRLLRKGGEIMGTSSFEKAVCLQFNALMMILIKGTLSSHRRQIARRSRHEILFCELSEMKRVEHGINDEYFFDFTSFQVLNFTIRVSNEELGIALQDRYGCIFIFLYTDSQLDQHHLLKMLSFFHCIFLASVLKIKYQ